MKLESFKFQDGKVFWLPEYPEKPDYETWVEGDPDTYSTVLNNNTLLRDKYDKTIAKSLASAIEVAPGDEDKIFKLLWWQTEKSRVYSAECEIEVKEKCRHGCRLDPFAPRPAAINVQDACLNGDKLTCVFYHQVARLKPKEEIFPAANSHDMKIS